MKSKILYYLLTSISITIMLLVMFFLISLIGYFIGFNDNPFIHYLSEFSGFKLPITAFVSSFIYILFNKKKFDVSK